MEKTILVRVDHSGKDEYAYAPRGKVLYDRFMDLLFEVSPVKRSVTFYAEKLCVTPKYLSSIVKEYSGKTACEMIREKTLNEMTYRLRYTTETVKEIAFQLDFPNLSFFGKFFKSFMGMSPMKYRKLYAMDGVAKE